MSLSYIPLQPIKILDPITNVQSIHSYAVYSGGDQVSYKQYTSTSISNSSIQWSCPPPSAQIIVDRNLQVVLPVRLTFTGKLVASNALFVPNSTLLNANRDAPREFPFSSSCDTLRVTLNNTSVSQNMSDVIHPLMRYNANDALRSREYSGTANVPDQSYNYSDLFGTARNPLAGYGDTDFGDALGRGAAQFTVVTNPSLAPAVGAGTDVTAVVDLLISENIFLSPMFWGSIQDNNQGFYNLQACDIDMNFIQNGFRMWSHMDGPIATSGADTVLANITGITMQFSAFAGPAFSYPSQANPLLMFKYITPSFISTQNLSPMTPVSYPYADVNRYVTTIGTLTHGAASTPYTSNNLQLNQIPDRMIVLARPSRATLESRCDLTDCYLAIQSINVQFANASVLLSTASQQQLYNINVKNGYEGSWAEFTGQQVYNGIFPGTAGSARYGCGGGPLCLRFGQDIQLAPDEAPGLQGQYQVAVTVSLKNMNSGLQWDNIPFEIVVIVINAGVFTITSQGAAQQQLGVLSKLDILSADSRPGINANSSALRRVNGGNFLGSLSDFGSRINDFLKESKIASVIASEIPLPGMQALSKVVSNMGYGSGTIGGARLTKQDLRRSLLDR